MAPRQTSGSSLTPAASPRRSRNTNTNTSTSARDIQLPPSPEQNMHTSISPLTSQVSLDSEVDLESESDLPTMTPPSAKHLPPRHRDDSPPDNLVSGSQDLNNGHFAMPQMQRAHSSPGADSSGRLVTPNHPYTRRPPSPLSSGRRRSPLRSAFEESYPASSWASLSIEPNIPENAELEIPSPVTPENELGNVSAIPTYSTISNTFPRSRRRPTSPLHQSASAPSLHTNARAAGLHGSGGNSPSFSSLSAAKFTNELYPTYGYSLSSASSMPSTPTSLRSRSPSISSLETIEDTPDAEEAARLEEENTKQRGNDESELSLDTRRKGVELRVTGLRSNKDRKRWSVCGAERRADFSLEPIEE